MCNVLAVDGENDPAVLSINAGVYCPQEVLRVWESLNIKATILL